MEDFECLAMDLGLNSAVHVVSLKLGERSRATPSSGCSAIITAVFNTVGPPRSNVNDSRIPSH